MNSAAGSVRRARRKADMPDNVSGGIIVMDKHEGVSSFRIIQILRKMFDTKKVGHTGTLDPMATGVLPVLVGRAVKASEYVMSGEKTYEARMILGVETDTEDTTGTVIARSDAIPDDSEVLAACGRFVGEIMQTPPMYSAIWQDGRRMYEIAREGGTVERAPRSVTVGRIEALKIGEREWALSIDCSKGTYVRTLCADIGRSLGCGAAMSALRRTRSGAFTLEHAHTIEELEGLSLEQRCELLLPVESAFGDLRCVELSDFFARLASCGAEIYLKKIGFRADVGTLVRLRRGGEFFALGRVDEFDDGLAIRPIKQF